jgi:hypothetical protein
LRENPKHLRPALVGAAVVPTSLPGLLGIAG